MVLDGSQSKGRQLNKAILPKGVQIVPYYDRTWLIDTTLKRFSRTCWKARCWFTWCCYLFLGNLRAAAIVAVMIPLSLLATFIGLKLRGIPANLLSLGAMDFGIIVDGAVIVVENIFRKLSERRARARPQAIQQGHSGSRDRGRAADLLLDADHHRRPHSDLHPAAPRRPHLRADGVHSDLGADWFAALLADTGSAALLLPAAEKHCRTRKISSSRVCKRVYQPLLELGARRPQSGRRRRRGRAAVSLGLVPRLGTEFLPELNEGTHLGQHQSAARHLGHRGHQAMRPHPRRSAHSSRSQHGHLQGRPARGRHRSQADQHGRSFRGS